MKHKGYGKLVCAVLLGISLVLLTGCYSLLADWELQTATSAPASTKAPPAHQVVEEPEVDVPVQQVYKIGAKGPASGLVFYDKEITATDGDIWKQHRSVGRVPYDPKAMGRISFSMNGAQLGTDFGTGLENSEHITIYNRQSRPTAKPMTNCPRLRRYSLHSMTVRLRPQCLDAVINRFDDWYLPSQDELVLMRESLYKHDLGSFQADLYWVPVWITTGAVPW